MREFDLADMDRRVSRLIRLGVVAEADYEKARVRVSIGKVVTNWLPWITRRAGLDVDWWAPSKGEQVVVLAPDGEFNNAVVLGSVYQAKHPAPESNPKVRLTRMEDGATFRYDSENSALTIELTGSAKVLIEGDATVEVNGDLIAKVGGNASVDVDGDLAAKAGGTAKVDAKGVELNGGSPCVTTAHICHFTGTPHGDGSSTVKAGK